MSIADKKYKELIKEIAINGVWDKGDNTLPRTRYNDDGVFFIYQGEIMKCLNDVSCKDCVGKVCKSKSSGDFKIVKYNDARNVEIQVMKRQYI